MTTRHYLIVFGVLLALTALTVVVSSVPMPATLAIAVGLAIAAAKGSLVAMFFMHLRSERAMVYWPLGLSAVLFLALIAFVLWAEADHLFGTRFIGPFEGGTE